ncbi:hypothetical protein ACLOJK_011741 [Asimina triloba]
MRICYYAGKANIGDVHGPPPRTRPDKSTIYGRTCTRQRAPATYTMEHLSCSIINMRWAAAIATVGARAAAAGDRHQQTPPATTVRQASRRPRRRQRHAIADRQTHHGRAILAPIQAAHHDGDDERISDPSRPQADVDHSGHKRQIFLTRH